MKLNPIFGMIQYKFLRGYPKRSLGLEFLEQYRDDIIARWERSGLLDGLVGHQLENVAQLYEPNAVQTIHIRPPVTVQHIEVSFTITPTGIIFPAD